MSVKKEVISEKVIRIGFWKAIVVMVTAILGSAGASIWGTLAIANTIPFRVTAMEKQITEIQQNFMPSDLSLEKWKNNDAEHLVIIKKLDILEEKIDNIRDLLK